MKRLNVFTAIMLCLTCSGNFSFAAFQNFVSRSNDKLMDGKNEVRFVSFNIPNLHYIEDSFAFKETNPWRLPDEYEISDALMSIKQMGGEVVRIYTLSVAKADEDKNIPRHVLGPGQFNEEAFKALDKVLELANKYDIRIIIPFVDNWSWWGGSAEYAAFRGREPNEFWTDPQVIADFKQTIQYLINRTNTLTGVKYKDDKAILAWETGNELVAPHKWTREIAAFIKSLDKNHLVIDGYHTTTLTAESVDDPMIDIVTTHHYNKNMSVMFDQVKANRKLSQGKKPYFIGEVGFIDTPSMRTLCDIMIENGSSGVLVWSLRPHDRDGGFYWHAEPHGNFYKAYHWPGFESGDEYGEIELLKLAHQKAFQIRGLAMPPLEAPQAPFLLPIDDHAFISWRGSAGALGYDIERAASADGPWVLAGKDISDAAVQYKPLFSDVAVDIGASYYYRVKAKNTAGVSSSSNIVGPVFVKHLCLVDEMADYSLIHSRGGTLSLESKEPRKAKEDTGRIKGKKGNYIVYKVSKPIVQFTVYSFFPDAISDFKFSVSTDGNDFIPAVAARSDYYAGAGKYGYWKPVLYEAKIVQPVQFLKIEFTAEAQISRVEIMYGQ